VCEGGGLVFLVLAVLGFGKLLFQHTILETTVGHARGARSPRIVGVPQHVRTHTSAKSPDNPSTVGIVAPERSASGNTSSWRHFASVTAVQLRCIIIFNSGGQKDEGRAF